MKNLVIAFLCISMLGCSSKPSFDEAVVKIKAQNEKLHQVVATKNANLLNEVYAENAHFMAPGAGIITGRDSIIAAWKSGLDNMVEMNSKTISIGGTADVVYEVGIVETTIKTGQADSVFIYKAKYSNVWHRDFKGDYRLVVDIWNKTE